MSSSEENTMNDRITIEGRDGAFGAYISRPKTLPAPADSYPGQHHAFARHNGAHYNAAAAALANGRTSEFLHQQLR